MVANTRMPDATRERFEREMQRVHDSVRREYVRAGIVTEEEAQTWPRPNEKRYGADLIKAQASTECDRLTKVFSSAETVERAAEAPVGQRETAIEAFEALADAISRTAEVLNEDGPVTAYLGTVANVGSIVAFQDEARIDSSELTSLREKLDWHRLRRTAESAKACATHLKRRRPDAFNAGAYVAKGAGPFVHFIYELHINEGLTLEEVAEITGEMPPRSRFDDEGRWQDACDQVVQRLRQQILRFDRNVKASTGT